MKAEEDEEDEEDEQRIHPSMVSIGSIAMLFGALSARRLIKYQSKDFCGSDSTEHELNFDIASTTISGDLGYGSFASPWTRDDLEKFDV